MMLDFGRPTVYGGRQTGLLDRLVPWGARLPVQRFRLDASNELERSRRVFRLLFANWLAQVDRPAGAPGSAGDPKTDLDLCRRPVRPRRGPRRESGIPGQGPRPARDRGFCSARVRNRATRPGRARASWRQERRRRSVLIVRLAAELYRREHGAAPATAGALLGTVLKELPEGIAADDPIPAGPE